MKRITSFIIALSFVFALSVTAVFAEEDPAKQVVTVSEDGLFKRVDFTLMENTDKVLGEIEPDMVGAVDIDHNYQIGFNDGMNVLFTVQGFNPAWIIYEVEAPKGQVLETCKLTIYGRIADYRPVKNGFAVFARDDGFTGEGEACELNLIPADMREPDDWEDYAYYVQQAQHGTMANEGSVDDVHEFDLTEPAKGNSRLYIGIYQYTTDCPEWIEYKALEIKATAVDKTDNSTEDPADDTENPTDTGEEPTDGAVPTDGGEQSSDEPADTDATATDVPPTDKGNADTGKDKNDTGSKKGCGGFMPAASAAMLAMTALLLTGNSDSRRKKK